MRFVRLLDQMGFDINHPVFTVTGKPTAQNLILVSFIKSLTRSASHNKLIAFDFVAIDSRINNHLGWTLASR